jgi:hypothetical protein
MAAAPAKSLPIQGADYCYVANVLAGEQLRLTGASPAAEVFFRRITEKEPENPWGWYLLGELCTETGRAGQAAKFYETVLTLVPRHSPSRAALKELQKNGA